MTERPIIFSAPMIRAILAGRKTQTRRVLKQQPPAYTSSVEWHQDFRNEMVPFVHGEPQASVVVPYAPGDTLWVRETWAVSPHGPAGPIYCNADYGPHVARPGGGYTSVTFRADSAGRAWGMYGPPKWRSPIHMPRSAARITLRVTDVRVQRLQDITEEDARAEGAKAWADERLERPSPSFPSARSALYELWDTIHGPDAWDANPWVVAISFERIHA